MAGLLHFYDYFGIRCATKQSMTPGDRYENGPKPTWLVLNEYCVFPGKVQCSIPNKPPARGASIVIKQALLDQRSL